jgi:hypothetical protein
MQARVLEIEGGDLECVEKASGDEHINLLGGDGAIEKFSPQRTRRTQRRRRDKHPPNKLGWGTRLLLRKKPLPNS